MKAKSLLLVSLTLLVGAAEPSPAPLAAKGRILIVENERTLQGEIDRIGSQYRIRRSVGETWVPAERVIALCDGVEDAYRVFRGRANLRDPDERLRLAQWCRLHHLPQQALIEVQAAVTLRPEHVPSQRLLRHLQQASLEKPAAAPVEAAGLPELGPPPAVELTEEALGQFVSQVQPILMNACANCHAAGKGGAFRLTRTYESGSLNRRALQHNLAAVLAHVNVQQPHTSALLTKAVSVHGDLTQAPLKSRQAVAYRKLDDWVRRTVASNPQMQREAVPASFASSAPEARPVPTTPIKTAPNTTTPATGEVPSTKKEETPPDPFDPETFNRQGVKPTGKP